MAEARDNLNREGVMSFSRVVAGVLLVGLGAAACAEPSGEAPAAAPLAPSAATDAHGTAGQSPDGSTQNPQRKPEDDDALETVRSREQPTKSPVPIDDTAQLSPGVTVRLADSAPVQLEGEGPGVLAGPGVRLDLVITNGSGAAVNLMQANVTLTYGPEDTPAASGPAVMERPFNRRLAAGEQQSASYVFAVPPSERKQVTVLISKTADQPIAVLRGPLD